MFGAGKTAKRVWKDRGRWSGPEKRQSKEREENEWYRGRSRKDQGKADEKTPREEDEERGPREENEERGKRRERKTKKRRREEDDERGKRRERNTRREENEERGRHGGAEKDRARATKGGESDPAPAAPLVTLNAHEYGRRPLRFI